MRIRCLRPILWRGRVRPPGDVIELDAGAAERLCGAGLAEKAKADPKPAPAAPAKDEAPAEKPAAKAKAKPRKKAAKKKATAKK